LIWVPTRCTITVCLATASAFGVGGGRVLPVWRRREASGFSSRLSLAGLITSQVPDALLPPIKKKSRPRPLFIRTRFGIRYYVGSGRLFCTPALFLDGPGSHHAGHGPVRHTGWREMAIAVVYWLAGTENFSRLPSSKRAGHQPGMALSHVPQTINPARTW